MKSVLRSIALFICIYSIGICAQGEAKSKHKEKSHKEKKEKHKKHKDKNKKPPVDIVPEPIVPIPVPPEEPKVEPVDKPEESVTVGERAQK